MRVFLFVIVLFALAPASSFKIGGKVEPLYEIKEKGSLQDSGSSEAGLHRAQITLKYKEEIVNDWTISGRFTFDASENELEEMVHQAFVAMKFGDPLKVQVGRFKPAFSRNAQIGSSKLPTIYRSWTTEHLKDDLGVAGYLDGVELSGDFFENKLFYSVALNYYEHDSRDGYSVSRMVSLPFISLGSSPFEGLTIRWDMAFPLTALSYENGNSKEERLMLHDWSLTYEAPKLYKGTVEAFLGADTSQGMILSDIHETYSDNVQFSLQLMNEFYSPRRNGFGFFGARGGEYLNGLNYREGAYVDREFYYAAVGVLGATYEDLLRVQISYDQRFDHAMASINEGRFAFQVGLKKDIKIGGGKK